MLKYICFCIFLLIFVPLVPAQKVGKDSTKTKTPKPKRENFEKLRVNPDKAYRLKRAYEFYEAKDYLKAQYLMEDLIPQYRGTPEAEKIFFKYADTYYNLGDFSLAQYYFKQFHSTFPNSAFAEQALYLSAEASYQLSPSFRLTQEDTEKAIEGFQLFVNSYPASDKVQKCNEKIDKLRKKGEIKEIENAKGYLQRRQYQGAIHTLQNILISYPDIDDVENVRFMLLKAMFKFAEKSIEDKQPDRFRDAFAQYDIFKRKYPSSKFLPEADKMKLKAERFFAKNNLKR